MNAIRRKTAAAVAAIYNEASLFFNKLPAKERKAKPIKSVSTNAPSYNGLTLLRLLKLRNYVCLQYPPSSMIDTNNYWA